MSISSRKNDQPVDPLLGKPASFGIHRYLQGSANLFEENRLLKFAIIGLFGITTVLGAEIYSSDQNRRTVIRPFGAGGDLYVTGSKPSTDYLRAMARNVVDLRNRYLDQADSARGTFDPSAPITSIEQSSLLEKGRFEFDRAHGTGDGDSSFKDRKDQ